MTFMHSPTVLSLAIGGGMALLDLWRGERRPESAMLEDLARLRLGSRTLLDCLEEANLAEVSRDPFGDVLNVTWRADATTIMMAACDLMRQRWTTGGQPLPNKRLKLTGAHK